MNLSLCWPFNAEKKQSSLFSFALMRAKMQSKNSSKWLLRLRHSLVLKLVSQEILGLLF